MTQTKVQDYVYEEEVSSSINRQSVNLALYSAPLCCIFHKEKETDKLCHQLTKVKKTLFASNMGLRQWAKIFLLIAVGIAFGNGSHSLRVDDLSIPPSLTDGTAEDSIPQPLLDGASEVSLRREQGLESKSLLIMSTTP